MKIARSKESILDYPENKKSSLVYIKETHDNHALLMEVLVIYFIKRWKIVVMPHIDHHSLFQ